MKTKNYTVVLFLFVLLSACSLTETDTETGEEKNQEEEEYTTNNITSDEQTTEEDDIVIDKTKNMCAVDSDCTYVWYTGGCQTPEFVEAVTDRCQDGTGPCPSEAQPRDGVTCTCEENRCVTEG